jgi:anti-sigma28 factor (negative regulator of flagellin synthesis)
MSEVNPIAGPAGAPLSGAVQRAHLDATFATQGASAAQGAPRTQLQDRVELSEHARHLDKLRQLPDVRESKVQAARSAIADGVFETPDRLRAALLRMLDEIEPS